VIERDQGEGEESPEDESVGEAGERALADDLGLAEDLPDEEPDALSQWMEGKVIIFFGVQDVSGDRGEAVDEEGCRSGDGEEQEGDF
jgi:hypothetical protein